MAHLKCVSLTLLGLYLAGVAVALIRTAKYGIDFGWLVIAFMWPYGATL